MLKTQNAYILMQLWWAYDDNDFDTFREDKPSEASWKWSISKSLRRSIIIRKQKTISQFELGNEEAGRSSRQKKRYSALFSPRPIDPEFPRSHPPVLSIKKTLKKKYMWFFRPTPKFSRTLLLRNSILRLTTYINCFLIVRFHAIENILPLLHFLNNTIKWPQSILNFAGETKNVLQLRVAA